MRPKKAGQLFTIEAVRRVHFPVILYFLAFIAVHVVLVFATGALRNLNHMYAAQATDPSAYASNWFGLGMFVHSLAVNGGTWAASQPAGRPFLLAPVASPSERSAAFPALLHGRSSGVGDPGPL